MKEELMGFAEFLTDLKYCYRVAPFLVQYMPNTDLIRYGVQTGELDESEVRRLNEGLHDNYMADGSVGNNKRRLRLLNGYRVMFRLMSFLPPAWKKLLLRSKLYNIFWMAPFRLFISVLDVLIAMRDEDASTYAKNYWWWLRKRFDKKYHLYVFKKRKRFENLSSGPFQLSGDGVIGEKTLRGWERKSSAPEVLRNE
jgi:hypothetical protein